MCLPLFGHRSPSPSEPPVPDPPCADRTESLGHLFRSAILHQVDASCEATREADRQLALDVVRQLHRNGALPHDTVLERMLKLLRDSRLTINFSRHQVRAVCQGFANKAEFKNVYALSPEQLKAARTDRYLSEKRIPAENETFALDALLQRPEFKNLGFDAPAGRPNAWASRPLYGAADVFHLPHGGARGYGRSFLVLEERLKQVSTLTHDDSIQTFLKQATPSRPGSFLHPERLLAEAARAHLDVEKDQRGRPVPDTFFKTLLDRAVAGAPPSSGAPQVPFIEAQVHASVRLDRDVRELHLSRRDLEEALPADEIARLLKFAEYENRRRSRRFICIDE